MNDDENEIDDLVGMNRQLVYRCNPFERYNDLEFYGRYRFSKAATRHLIDIMRNDFERATKKLLLKKIFKGMPKDVQLLKITLHVNILLKLNTLLF